MKRNYTMNTEWPFLLTRSKAGDLAAAVFGLFYGIKRLPYLIYKLNEVPYGAFASSLHNWL